MHYNMKDTQMQTFVFASFQIFWKISAKLKKELQNCTDDAKAGGFPLAERANICNNVT